MKLIRHFCCIMFAATLTCTVQAKKSTTPSKLVPDTDGVLWFVKGDDKQTPLYLSAKLSKQEPYFVVFVSTTDEFQEPAIRHARNLAKWFEEHPDAPDKVPVIAYKSEKHTYYMFHNYGIRYRDVDLHPSGIMNPQESQKLREDAALSFRVRTILKKQGEFEAVFNEVLDP